MKQILPMKKVWSVKEMHKLVNKMINNRIAKKISLIKKRSRYCNNVKNTFKDGYRQYKPSNILLSFLNSCVSILGLLLLRAITFWYVFPIFDILGINYSPPINFSSFNLIMQSKFDKTSTILLWQMLHVKYIVKQNEKCILSMISGTYTAI